VETPVRFKELQFWADTLRLLKAVSSGTFTPGSLASPVENNYGYLCCSSGGAAATRLAGFGAPVSRADVRIPFLSENTVSG